MEQTNFVLMVAVALIFIKLIYLITNNPPQGIRSSLLSDTEMVTMYLVLCIIAFSGFLTAILLVTLEFSNRLLTVAMRIFVFGMAAIYRFSLLVTYASLEGKTIDTIILCYSLYWCTLFSLWCLEELHCIWVCLRHLF